MRKIAHELIKRAYVQKLKDALTNGQLRKQAGLWGSAARAWAKRLVASGKSTQRMINSLQFRATLGDLMQRLHPGESVNEAMMQPMAKKLKAGRMYNLLKDRNKRILIGRLAGNKLETSGILSKDMMKALPSENIYGQIPSKFTRIKDRVSDALTGAANPRKKWNPNDFFIPVWAADQLTKPDLLGRTSIEKLLKSQYPWYFGHLK